MMTGGRPCAGSFRSYSFNLSHLIFYPLDCDFKRCSMENGVNGSSAVDTEKADTNHSNIRAAVLSSLMQARATRLKEMVATTSAN